MGRGAVFLDRDGTIIDDVGYPNSPGQVRFKHGVVAALRKISAIGWPLVVVSNQSGVGRGLISRQQASAVHDRFVEVLTEERVLLAGVYYCFHLPSDACGCRKPSPGMLRLAADELGFDLSASVLIGDKTSDMEAGLACGCRCILIEEPPSEVGLRWSTSMDMESAAKMVLEVNP
jgi:histidinol-phosphate phosphatase family protein